MALGGDYASKGFDRQGRGLLAGSAFVLLLLSAAAIGTVLLGAEHWRQYANPDPFGMFSGLFFVTSMGLLLSTVVALFILAAYAGEYRNAWTRSGREEAGRRWLGSIFIFSGLPFFILGIIAFGDVGRLLWLGALVAFGAGTAYFLSAYLRARGTPLWPPKV